MRCRRVEQLLSDHLEALLPEREALAVAAHLAQCPACRRLRDAVLAIGAELRAPMGAPPLPEVDRRAIEQWMAEREAAAMRGRRGSIAWPAIFWARPALFGCAAALLLTALGLAAWRHHPAGGPGQDRLVTRPDRGATTDGRRPTAPAEIRRAGRPAERLVNPPPIKVVSGRPSAVVPAGTSRRGTDRDDLVTMNGGPAQESRPSRSRPVDVWSAWEERAQRAVPVRDDFVQVPFPRVATTSDRQVASAAENYQREAAIVDARLAREVTLRQKATALADLCERLRSDTGIPLTAGQSVADEKVTVFCEKLPLRDVMRQLSRPFGYAWLRSGKPGEYKYELVQDLRSQLLEEELRNRDRNEALLALDREIQRYRPYLGLTPDEALARSRTAAPAEKKLLETMASYGWGAVQMYVRLSAQDLAAMRAGQTLTFSAVPEPGQRPLPPELGRGMLQPFRDWYVARSEKGYGSVPDSEFPGALAVPAVPEARAKIDLRIVQGELGRMGLWAETYCLMLKPGGQGASGLGSNADEKVSAVNPTVLTVENAAANAALAREPALRPRVTLRPQPSCLGDLSPQPPPRSGEGEPSGTPAVPPKPRFPSPLRGGAGGEVPQAPKVTSADVLEALHRATGLPIVADYYTRLSKPETVTVPNRPLFDALNQVADAMRLRWRWDGTWLQFRSASYYHDRLKEVPNRLLSRWVAARRQHGILTLDDLVEIAQLPDAQLDGGDMAEGARLCLGLTEWDLARNGNLRPNLRYLAGFTPEQRQETMTATGLPFTRMSLAQQQQFIAYVLSDAPLQSLEDLAGATLRVEYSHSGEFQWGKLHRGDYLRWVVPMTPGAQGRRVVRPPVRERTREAALQAVQRVDPKIREALLEWKRRADPRLEASPRVVEEEEIYPTQLDLTFAYIPGFSNARMIRVTTFDGNLNATMQ
jgi:Putative zinc-finger